MAAAWAALLVAVQLGAAPEAPLYSEGARIANLPAAPGGQLPDLTRLAQAAMPAVVGVLTTQRTPPTMADDSLRDLFDKLHDGPRKGVGSGFVIRPGRLDPHQRPRG
ncbi:MAG: hypothetical protein QM767_07775 [Anaeromyxobacter sp.]